MSIPNFNPVRDPQDNSLMAQNMFSLQRLGSVEIGNNQFEPTTTQEIDPFRNSVIEAMR